MPVILQLGCESGSKKTEFSLCSRVPVINVLPLVSKFQLYTGSVVEVGVPLGLPSLQKRDARLCGERALRAFAGGKDDSCRLRLLPRCGGSAVRGRGHRVASTPATCPECTFPA